MDTITTLSGLRSRLARERSEGRSVGLVPTMGFLHKGHLSLIEAAVAEHDFVVTTIFVNPLQFAPGEDLETYPRDIESDSDGVRDAGGDVVFVPSTQEMYPNEMLTSVEVPALSHAMEGASRRTHFGGVATVVAKLFSIVGECSAYFGEKDYQQLAIVTRMASDLSMPVRVVGCPTVREADGLAMSSRNAYLTVEERMAAPVLNRALRSGAELIAAGERDPRRVRTHVAEIIEKEPLGVLDYVEIADSATLEVAGCGPRSRVFGAVAFGGARLIDNVGVSSNPEETRS